MLLCSSSSCARRAFTLVELSIVLAIFGMIVGVILGGKAMIRASQMRSVLEQHSLFLKAVNAFQEKYNYLPGDLPNAVEYWGLAGGPNGDGIVCRNTASTTTATCNGDGDGKIATVLLQGPETLRFWQHLSNAGLIEGRFTGSYDGGGVSHLNVPQSKLISGLWVSFDLGIRSGEANFFDGEYNNSMSLGGYLGGSTIPSNVIMTTSDILGLDRKADDGMPGTGKFVVYGGGSLSNCTTTASSSTLTATYTPATRNNGCTIIFRDQF
jgi:prepilin-type N-terminal cleavage/methylation domain-containing protein